MYAKTSYETVTIKNIGKGYQQMNSQEKKYKYLKRLTSHSHLTKYKLKGVIFRVSMIRWTEFDICNPKKIKSEKRDAFHYTFLPN